MRISPLVFFFPALLSVYLSAAQPALRVVVPQHPVVAGEAFQVQFILEGTEEPVSSFQSPAFTKLRLVSGPVLYAGKSGSGKKPGSVRNYVYTLEAAGTGTVFIPAFTLQLGGGRTLQSHDAFVRVIGPQEAARQRSGQPQASEYLLAKGEDPQAKIRRNLFMKLELDRRRCYPGEPITAVFKLYSRLQSRSDIVRNPGFYGFTVYDMVNLADHLVTTETVNGLLYDVHTVRKLQLFPLRPGVFTIDEMEVNNKVEFSRTGVNRKTEQEVVEGLFGNDDNAPVSDEVVVVEHFMHTPAVQVTVDPYPVTAAPEGFAGAAGEFTVAASLRKDHLSKNEAGELAITVSGKGNFTQLVPPVIKWPDGIEVFEPEISDDFNRQSSPLSGRRVFRYRFTVTKPGTYKLQPPAFVYFNTDSNRFARLQPAAISLEVDAREPAPEKLPEEKTSLTTINRRVSRVAAALVILAVITVLVYWGTRKKRPEPLNAPADTPLPDAEAVFAPAKEALGSAGGFYSVLYQCNWDYYAARLHLQGFGMDKQALFDALRDRGAPGEQLAALENLLGRCEWNSYTATEENGDALQMLEESMALARKLAG